MNFRDLWWRMWNKDEFWKMPALVLAVVVAILWILMGCTTTPYTQEPGTHACLLIHWTEAPQERCNGAQACSTLGDGFNLNHVSTPMPLSFDDHWRVYLLGHEVLHSLGATHR